MAKATNPRQTFLNTVHRYGNACGEAQWTNGYRAASPTEEASLYAKERRQWEVAEIEWQKMTRALSAYLRAATKSRKRSRK